MNNATNYLYDIELPPTELSDFIGAVFVIITLFVLFILGRYHYQQQRPIARARRQLHLLPNKKVDPLALATLLKQGLQVQRLSDSNLPEDFLQRLNQARFSAQPCHLATFTQLKKEAQYFLEQKQ